MKKFVVIILSLTSLNLLASAIVENDGDASITNSMKLYSESNRREDRICGQGGIALINDYGECVQTLTTCETYELMQKGWKPTESGLCEETN